MNKQLNLREVIENAYIDSDVYKKYKEWIDFELNHLELHDLDDYVYNLIAIDAKVSVNPNNSSILYLLGITSVPPTAKISTMGGTKPDIDSDIEHTKREQVFQYLKGKYGNGFAHIGTFSVSQGRGLFKDVCRIFDVEFNKSNEISKLLPENAHYIPIKEVLVQNPEFKKHYDEDPLIKEVVDYAIKMEGCVKSLGVHAAGVILADEPITNYLPLFCSKDASVTQFDADTVDKIGFNKLDVLGLKTLSVLSETFRFIKERHNVVVTMENIPLDDEASYKVFPAKNTLGIFQMEDVAITEFGARCNPKTIYDISNVISLWRPGPMSMPNCLSNYIKACNGYEKFDFPFPEYNYIFDKTYNFLVYQEQLSRLSMDMCGFTGPRADELRKVVSKKDRVALVAMREEFINGAVNKGHDKDKVAKLFDDMEEFSRYAFNLSHGISYSYLTYFTAYLKTHYPSEFFASAISLEDDPSQKSKYIDDARKNGLNVYPPDINQSKNGFTIGTDGSILFGFNGIKGLGPAVTKKILDSRPYSSFGDFLIKSTIIKGVNKKAIEALIHSGALDCFGYRRSCMIRSFEKYILDFSENGKLKEFPKERIQEYIKLQDDYFKDNSFAEFSIFDILEKEKELIGIYISGNPFDLIGSVVSEDYHSFQSIIDRLTPGNKIIEYSLCEIVKFKKHKTPKGQEMAFLDCKDSEGTNMSLTMFPNIYEKYKDMLRDGLYILASAEFKKDSRGLGGLVYSLTNISEKISTINIKDIKKKSRNTIELHIIGTPSTVKCKTVFSKISQYANTDNLDCIINLYVDIDKTKYLIKSIPVVSVDIDVIRDLNKIPDIYVSKANAR